MWLVSSYINTEKFGEKFYYNSRDVDGILDYLAWRDINVINAELKPWRLRK